MAAAADTLTPDQALARALNEDGARMKSRAQTDYTFSHTFSFRNVPIGYMFETGSSGFVLVSADDMAAPMLGYSNTQRFDVDNIPDGLKYWLDTYAKEVEWAKEQGLQPVQSVSRADDKAPIAPLITTKWNQDAPYNDLCPTIQNKRCVTGCVATAMAQVLNYYKYPTKGKGFVKYQIDVTTDQDDNVISGTDWSFDFANTTFDWANMLDTYDSAATAAQRKAVATLMSACGVSVHADYSATMSGAFSNYVPQALINNFGYSKSAYYTSRDFYNLNDWETFVYDQLRANGPLLYDGLSSADGHAFVCDGYDGDGYFHFNWGWGGLSDGYFRLNALDPGAQGIGGSSSGFNFSQGLVCDLRASEGGEQGYSIVLLNPFEISEGTAKSGSKITWGNALVNNSATSFSGYVSLAFEPLNGGATLYGGPNTISRLSAVFPDGSMNYFENFTTAIPMLADGDYKIYPVWSKDSKVWHEVLRPVYGATYYTGKVKGGNMTIVAEAKSLPELSDVEISPLYVDQAFRIQANARNNGTTEYYGNVMACLFSSDGKTEIFKSTASLVDLMPGQSATFEIVDELKLDAEYTGAAKLLLVDVLSGRQLGDAYDVTIKSQDGKAKIEIGAIEYGNGYGNEQEANNLCFKSYVSCTSGYFNGYLYMYIFPYENGEVMSVGFIESDFIAIENGHSQEVVFKGSLPNGTEGKEYFVSIRHDDAWAGGELVFKLKNKSSAIELVPEDSSRTILYDLNGRRVMPGNAPKGIYISKPANGGKAMKVVVK